MLLDKGTPIPVHHRIIQQLSLFTLQLGCLLVAYETGHASDPDSLSATLSAEQEGEGEEGVERPILALGFVRSCSRLSGWGAHARPPSA